MMAGSARRAVHWDDVRQPRSAGTAAVRPTAPRLADLMRMNEKLLAKQQESIAALERLDKQLDERVDALDARLSSVAPSHDRSPSAPVVRGSPSRGAAGPRGTRTRGAMITTPADSPASDRSAILVEVDDPYVSPERGTTVARLSSVAGPGYGSGSGDGSLSDVCRTIQESMNQLRYDMLTEPSASYKRETCHEPDLTTVQIREIELAARQAARNPYDPDDLRGGAPTCVATPYLTQTAESPPRGHTQVSLLRKSRYTAYA